MNYALNTESATKKNSALASLRAFAPMLSAEKAKLVFAVFAILVNSSINLAGPFIMGYTVDTYVTAGNYSGVLFWSGILFVLYACATVAAYLQTTVMGGIAQRLLFNLRNTIFDKLQNLPVAFFNQNKAGDLISRINNDTDKLNQFFSQSLMQFIGNFIMILGAGALLLILNPPLGIATLAPAAILLVFSQLISAWIRKKNAKSLQATGGMSAEIQESLDNFKVIVAFDRRDYFRRKFDEANQMNYKSAVSAGVANTLFIPLYGLVANIAQLIALTYGIYLIAIGNLTVGLLISYLVYVVRFYDPLRQIAALWASFQLALASWDRIAMILHMESDLTSIPATTSATPAHLLAFENVHFQYPDGKEVLHGINFTLEQGKTYALVGPTGGGKTTTASLMARLYDPTTGTVMLNGLDIRSYSDTERTQKIGFILQEPFLFSGTVGQNIVYGNEDYAEYSAEKLATDLEKANLGGLLVRFEKGLDTPVSNGGESISLGQRQLIAFMRAVLRNPALLILDEATANIDTVTEQLLEDILKNLPKETTKVIIAHRLNTIENADEIFFVNSGEIIRAGSLDHAVDLLLHGKRQS